MTTTAEVKTGLEGLFQSAEAKSGELKDATRKSQANSAKSEAVGQYARTVRNEHIESAIGKVQELVNAGTIIDKNTLKVEISKIVDAADKNENLKKFKEVKSVAELNKLITEHPEEAKEYFTARALHFVANAQASKVGDLASSLNIVSEGNTGTPFDTHASTYGQFSFAGKKAPFVEEMKKVLENFTGDDAAKQKLIAKLEAAAKNDNIKNPNEMMQIISEAIAPSYALSGLPYDPNKVNFDTTSIVSAATNPNSAPSSALCQYFENPDVLTQYQTALTNLRNKDVKQEDFKDVLTSYLGKLQEKVQTHLDDENVRIAARAITLKTAVEKVEVAQEVPVSAEGKTTTKPYKSDIKKSDEELFRDAIRNKFGARIDIKTGEVLTPPESNSCLTFHGFKQGDFIESIEITVDKYVTQRAFAYIGGTQSEKEFKEALEKILKFEGDITIKKASARTNTAANNSLFVEPTNLNLTSAEPNPFDKYINNAKRAS